MTPIHILEQQAEQGSVDAQLELAFLYRNGLRVNKSDERAEYWTLKAVEQGDATAIGNQYSFGYGVEKSYGKAVEWFTKAAEQGVARAQNALGVCYKNGQGVEQSYEKALRYYIKSALQGEKKACDNIESIAKDNEDLILKEIEYQRRKLDLDIITKEEYDKIKDLLKKYIY